MSYTGNTQKDSLLTDLYDLQVATEILLRGGRFKTELGEIHRKVILIEDIILGKRRQPRGHFNLTLSVIALRGKLVKIRRATRRIPA